MKTIELRTYMEVDTCVKLPYRGYEISLSSRCPADLIVYKVDTLTLYSDEATVEGIVRAKTFIDNLLDEDVVQERPEVNCQVCDGGPNGHTINCPVLDLNKNVLVLDAKEVNRSIEFFAYTVGQTGGCFYRKDQQYVSNLDGVNRFGWKIVATPIGPLQKPKVEDRYTRPVKFTATNLYGCGPEGDDDVYTREEFQEQVDDAGFFDYDGWGNPVKDGKADESIVIRPSTYPACMPEDATHVVWYNK